MNIIAQSNTVRILRNVALAFVLIVSTGGAFPAIAHAQYAEDGGCCGGGSYASSIDYSYPASSQSYGGSIDYSYPGSSPSYASSIDYTYPGSNQSYASSIDYTYPASNSSYANSIDYTYPGSNPSYYDTYTSSPSYYDTYSPTGYSSGYDYGYSLSYNYGSYGYSYPSYSSYVSPSYAYATPSYVQPSYSTSITTVSNPTTITDSGNTNTYAPYYSTYISTVSNPTTITDSGNSAYTSTYTSTTNIDSHNVTNVDSHNVTNVSSVSQATPQYVAQAYLPSYPSYYPYYNYTYSYPYTYAATPSCTISARQGANGQTVLTWYSTNATSAYISPAVGTVALSGSTTIYPYGNSLYTLTVSGSGGTATCQTSVTPATVAYTAPVTTAPYVALTQIPYTGFDYGPIGNTLYWLGLLSFAVAGAYLVVYYRGGAFSLATAMIRREGTPTAAKRTATIADVIAPAVHAEHSNDVKQGYTGVRDVMTLVPAKNGLAPCIVISRC